MENSWYPDRLLVGPEGTFQTYEFMKSVYGKYQHFSYAEFGIYKADTARHICEYFPNATLHLFDFVDVVSNAKDKLSIFQNKIFYYGNTQKYNDSYNWSLLKLIEHQKNEPLFDYCFLDGAHTFAIDALNFYLCDILLRPGGYIDFDDYNWRIRGSSLDPSKIPEIKLQYTDEQIDSQQVKLIVDHLVKSDNRYQEIRIDKIFQKTKTAP